MRKLAILLLPLLALSCATVSKPTTGPVPAAVSSELTPDAILGTMKKVADWQLVNPSPSAARYTNDNAWTYAAWYTGMMALDDIADDRKYREAMIALGKKWNWHLARRIYHADDHCVGQTYLELYAKEKDPAMLKPTKDRFDHILANRSTDSLDYQKRGRADRYWWCDALFMGPPTWARLAKVTGDQRYLQFMDEEWWLASDYLYDVEEHLYFRDSRYFEQKEANGKEIFWGRGNGWVIAGLARVLDVLPGNHPTRWRYEQQFKEMAARIAALQRQDGLWRASLLDPDSYPLKETSGSGFYTFALAWGINNGLLDEEEYGRVVRKGWRALVYCVTPEGKLEHVQPVGADPKKFEPTDTEVYGTGAFLLAGREMYRLAGGKIQQ